MLYYIVVMEAAPNYYTDGTWYSTHTQKRETLEADFHAKFNTSKFTLNADNEPRVTCHFPRFSLAEKNGQHAVVHFELNNGSALKMNGGIQNGP